MFHIPKNNAGITQNHTVIIMRLRSMPSRTWAVVRVTEAGR